MYENEGLNFANIADNCNIQHGTSSYEIGTLLDVFYIHFLKFQDSSSKTAFIF